MNRGPSESEHLEDEAFSSSATPKSDYHMLSSKGIYSGVRVDIFILEAYNSTFTSSPANEAEVIHGYSAVSQFAFFHDFIFYCTYISYCNTDSRFISDIIWC